MVHAPNCVMGATLLSPFAGTTHWTDCWRVHHACAVAKIEADAGRLRGPNVTTQAVGWRWRYKFSQTDNPGGNDGLWHYVKDANDIPKQVARSAKEGGIPIESQAFDATGKVLCADGDREYADTEAT